jgi:hypothetical protein
MWEAIYSGLKVIQIAISEQQSTKSPRWQLETVVIDKQADMPLLSE